MVTGVRNDCVSLSARAVTPSQILGGASPRKVMSVAGLSLAPQCRAATALSTNSPLRLPRTTIPPQRDTKYGLASSKFPSGASGARSQTASIAVPSGDLGADIIDFSLSQLDFCSADCAAATPGPAVMMINTATNAAFVKDVATCCLLWPRIGRNAPMDHSNNNYLVKSKLFRYE